MGGMAAQIPIKGDLAANNIAMDAVKSDKFREVTSGHDGTWVAHPGLVPIAREVFDEYMKDSNQISKQIDREIKSIDLLRCPDGLITFDGLRKNINIGILYIENWLRGNGCVPLYNLMEDAATAEISRTQVWQWIRHQKFDTNVFDRILDEELLKIRIDVGEDLFLSGRYHQAAQLFEGLSTSSNLTNFLTVPAYHMLVGDIDD